MKNILFVDDEPKILSGLQRMLRGQRDEWHMVFVEGGEAALEELEAAPFDVIVSDMMMPRMDGATLLEEVQRRYPTTVRIVLSGHTDLAMAMRTVMVAHQFLTKPCESDTIKEVVTRTCNLRDLLASPELTELVGQIDVLPPAPRIYQELTAALLDPDVSLDRLTGIVEQDYAICAKILQLVNSSFFALARRVSNVRQAVSYLGANTLKNLVLTAAVFRQFEGSKLPDWFEFEAEQRHATLAARIAGSLLSDRKAAEDAHTAAMLHDTGRLVFAVKLPELYRKALDANGPHDWPQCDLEKARLGASHGEIGAYLLGIWGLPFPIVEAVAFHEAPSRAGLYEFDLLGAVHVADVLAREIVSGDRAPPLDQTYVDGAKIGDRLPEWRDLAGRLAEEPGMGQDGAALGGQEYAR